MVLDLRVRGRLYNRVSTRKLMILLGIIIFAILLIADHTSDKKANEDARTKYLAGLKRHTDDIRARYPFIEL